MQNTSSNTTFKKFNILLYFILAASTLLAYYIYNFDWYYTIATAIFVHQFLVLYFSLGKKLPIRALAGTMFSLNYLLAPALMYFWLNPFVEADDFIMRGDYETYFTYAIPAMLLFLIGMNIIFKKGDESLDIDKLKKIVDKYPGLPFQLILVGIVSEFLIPITPSEAVIIFSTLSYFKFIGLFLSILAGKGFNLLFFLLSYGLLMVRSLTTSMFNDLLNMLFFLGLFLCLRYKPSHLFKLGGVVVGLLFVVFIQNIKSILRSQVTNSLSDLSNLSSVIKESKSENAERTREERVAKVVFRLSQGIWTSGTMEYYYQGGYDFQNGKHSLLVLKSSILPRIIAPDRFTVGDNTLFNKYSGHTINNTTSIGLGILADGFIDFGNEGIYIVFAFGLMLGYLIILYSNLKKRYILIQVFAPISFFNIRPDVDTYAILGALIKITFILWLVMIFFDKFYFKENEFKNELLPAS